MELITWYNFEKFTPFDIRDYIESRGYKTRLVKEPYVVFEIENTYVEIEIPFASIGDIFAHIRYKDHYRGKMIYRDVELSRKVYKLLGRKFHRKKDEHPRVIKDFDRIVKLWTPKYKRWWKRCRDVRHKLYGDTGQEID